MEMNFFLKKNTKMNVYFINPKFLNPNRIGILLDILKVERIINLKPFDEKDNEILKICKSKCVYDIGHNDIESGIKQAVYAFIQPMSTKTRLENGTNTYIYKDLYKESKAGNPVYNLERCNDENVLIFLSNNYKISYMFVNYTTNIFNKYASQLHFEDRIGYYYIDSFLCSACYVDKNKMISITQFYQKDLVGTYNPLLSYIAMKIKEQFSLLEALDINYFFLTEKGYDEYNNMLDNYYEEQEYSSHYYGSDDSDWGQKEESDYIFENGGDWILD